MNTTKMIKTIMVLKGVSISELAERMGKSPSSVGTTINRGKMTVDSLKQILKALDEDLVITTKNGNKFRL